MARKKRKPDSSQRRLRAEMQRIGKQLDVLGAAARRAEASLAARSRVELRKLKVRQAAAKRTLAKLGRQSSAAGGPLKAGLRKAWRDIEAAVRLARRRFQETR